MTQYNSHLEHHISHIDSINMAKESLEHCEALFLAIMKLADDKPQLEHLARLGQMTADEAIDEFGRQVAFEQVEVTQ